MLNIAKTEELIKFKGWSNTYFCKKMGHSRTWVSDMKRGIGLPDENMIRAIMRAVMAVEDKKHKK